jgi:hypothetical protein
MYHLEVILVPLHCLSILSKLLSSQSTWMTSNVTASVDLCLARESCGPVNLQKQSGQHQEEWFSPTGTSIIHTSVCEA